MKTIKQLLLFTMLLTFTLGSSQVNVKEFIYQMKMFGGDVKNRTISFETIKLIPNSKGVARIDLYDVVIYVKNLEIPQGTKLKLNINNSYLICTDSTPIEHKSIIKSRENIKLGTTSVFRRLKKEDFISIHNLQGKRVLQGTKLDLKSKELPTGVYDILIENKTNYINQLIAN